MKKIQEFRYSGFKACRTNRPRWVVTDWFFSAIPLQKVLLNKVSFSPLAQNGWVRAIFWHYCIEWCPKSRCWAAINCGQCRALQCCASRWPKGYGNAAPPAMCGQVLPGSPSGSIPWQPLGLTPWSPKLRDLKSAISLDCVLNIVCTSDFFVLLIF